MRTAALLMTLILAACEPLATQSKTSTATEAAKATELTGVCAPLELSGKATGCEQTARAYGANDDKAFICEPGSDWTRDELLEAMQTEMKKYGYMEGDVTKGKRVYANWVMMPVHVDNPWGRPVNGLLIRIVDTSLEFEGACK